MCGKSTEPSGNIAIVAMRPANHLSPKQRRARRPGDVPYAGASVTYAAGVTPADNRYGRDVLAPGWQRANRPVSTELTVARGQVVEDATTGFCGAVLRWENGMVVLEDRHGKRRSFPLGAGFLARGQAGHARVATRAARRAARRSGPRPGRWPARPSGPRWRCPAGSTSRVGTTPSWWRRSGATTCATSASSWSISAASTTWRRSWPSSRPSRGRRLGVLVDHLVPGSKETRIAEQVARGPGGELRAGRSATRTSTSGRR